MDETLEDDLVERLISESYEIVVSKLPKKTKEALINQIF